MNMALKRSKKSEAAVYSAPSGFEGQSGNHDFEKSGQQSMNYEKFFADKIGALKEEGRYRVFTDIERSAGSFPHAINHRNGEINDVTVWCSNDYLGMGQHPEVLEPLTHADHPSGAGAGGAGDNLGMLIFGLVLSIALMAVGATLIAKLLNKYSGVGYIGLAVIVCVAGNLAWDGGIDVIGYLNGVAG